MNNGDYYLWSTRLSGWFTAGGTYTSDPKQAKIYTHAEAIKQARIHYRNGMSEYGLLPISIEDLDVIAGRLIVEKG